MIAERTGILCDIRSWHVTALAGQRDSTRKKRDVVAARERVLSRRRERVRQPGVAERMRQPGVAERMLSRGRERMRQPGAAERVLSRRRERRLPRAYRDGATLAA